MRRATRDSSRAEPQMYRTRGHHLVVTEDHHECLRKAKEAEAERDAQRTRVHGPDSPDPAVSPLRERPSPAALEAL